jgi:hypothetical protein
MSDKLHHSRRWHFDATFVHARCRFSRSQTELENNALVCALLLQNDGDRGIHS